MLNLSKQRLGVLGGMGPLASAYFMTRLTVLNPARRDQDHVPSVLWCDPRVPDRTAATLGQGDDPLPWLMSGMRGLERAGCDLMVMPCNTAHAWYEALRAASSLEIIHIVDAVADELENTCAPHARVGLLATRGTIASRLYQKRLAPHGWDVIVPDDDTMTTLVHPAIAAVKQNQPSDAARLLDIAIEQLREMGATVVVLGCTELPIGLNLHATPGERRLPIVDSVDALALAALRRVNQSALLGGSTHVALRASAPSATLQQAKQS